MIPDRALKLPKSTKRDVLTKSGRDAIVVRLNPLQQIEIQWGSKNAVHYSPEKVVIELNSSMGSGGGITQITSNDGSVTITNPNGPIVDLRASGSGNASIKMFKIVTIGQTNLYGAQAYDGANFTGPIVSIAKPNDLRTSISTDIVEGIPISYSYPGFPDRENNRTASDGTNSEIEVIYPRYKIGQVVFAAAPSNGTDLGGVSWVEFLPHRVWCRRYTQALP